jgi:hypothetical protein
VVTTKFALLWDVKPRGFCKTHIAFLRNVLLLLATANFAPSWLIPVTLMISTYEFLHICLAQRLICHGQGKYTYL